MGPPARPSPQLEPRDPRLLPLSNSTVGVPSDTV
jgi:hypothetical protein